ncbi:MAG: DUF488 domain-containing protein [Caulobacteraceae bacterium]|nr:DUF488 domain-containing protein [Caulobacteraceae bacterium]MDX5394134.1 DUF488 domain-containing protein [Caulobacteraceae bacterium]
MTPRLATIGYEGKTQAQMIAELKAAGVALVVDVRAVAASRRPGFSKTILAASLAEAGVGYEHLRGLGTPKAGRDAARAGRTDEMREIFSAHLAVPEAQVQLARAIKLARARPIALLCYEAQACDCHRAVVAERICEALETTVADL